MPGIEPGAFRMRSEHSTTELHPQRKKMIPCINNNYQFQAKFQSTLDRRLIYGVTKSIYLYTHKTLVVLLAWLIEAVRRFDNSRVQSTCYES